MKTNLLNRRHFLRAAGTILALPALESIGFRRFASAATTTVARPKRAVFLGFGWGVTEETWMPDAKVTGPDYTLPPGLAPLARHKADFTVVQGLTNKFANEAHWGSTFWLTGANRYAEPGQSFHNSISADQVVAERLGTETRFTSIQLSSPDGVANGHGPGLSLAWDVRGKPLAGMENPLVAYHRLFSDETVPLAQRQAMLAQKRSVLDAVLADAQLAVGDVRQVGHTVVPVLLRQRRGTGGAVPGGLPVDPSGDGGTRPPFQLKPWLFRPLVGGPPRGGQLPVGQPRLAVGER